MKLEHVACYVKDLEGMKAFYMKYFNAIPNEKYHNPRTGLMTYFLTFEEGARLEIMSRPDMHDVEKTLMQSGFIHITFKLGTKEKVDQMFERLKEDGFIILSGPRTTGDGYYELAFLDPENNQIELVA